MSDDIDQTKSKPPAFDFSAFPDDTVFYDRRTGLERRDKPAAPIPAPRVATIPGERRAKKERRKRIDPTTFEKQYTEDEMEFMTAMQKFKEHSGKPFPTYGEVLRVAVSLGYRRAYTDDDAPSFGMSPTAASSGQADLGPEPDVRAANRLPKSQMF